MSQTATTEAPQGRLLTVKDVATMLHLGQRSIWKFSACGELPAPISIGRLKRWDRQDMDAWIARKRVEADRARGNLPTTT